jgi:hypothetical protein
VWGPRRLLTASRHRAPSRWLHPQSTSLEPTKGLETPTPRHAPAQFGDAPIWISPVDLTLAARPQPPKQPPSYVGVCPRTAHVDTSIQAGRPIHEVRPRPRPRNIANSYKEAVHRCLSLLFRSLIFFCVEDQPCSVLLIPSSPFKVASVLCPS